MSLPNLPHYARQRIDGQWEGADHPSGPWRIVSPDGIRWTPWLTDGPAVLAESREPASVALEATGPRPLSPAAQAVLDAWFSSERGERMLGDPACLAAALRAVADQVVPEPSDCGPASHDYIKGADDRQKIVRFRLLALAAELEGLNG